MNLKTVINEDLESVFYDEDDFAEPAEYAGSEILFIEDEGSSRVEHFPGFHGLSMSIRVRKSEVPNPQMGQIVRIRGQDWRIGNGLRGDAGEWFVYLVRDETT